GHDRARPPPAPGSAEALAAEALQLAAVPLGGAAGAAVAARRGGEGLRRRARRRRRGAVGVAAHRDRRADPLLQDVADVDDPGRAVQPEPDLVAGGDGGGGLRGLVVHPDVAAAARLRGVGARLDQAHRPQPLVHAGARRPLRKRRLRRGAGLVPAVLGHGRSFPSADGPGRARTGCAPDPPAVHSTAEDPRRAAPRCPDHPGLRTDLRPRIHLTGLPAPHLPSRHPQPRTHLHLILPRLRPPPAPSPPPRPTPPPALPAPLCPDRPGLRTVFRPRIHRPRLPAPHLPSRHPQPRTHLTVIVPRLPPPPPPAAPPSPPRLPAVPGPAPPPLILEVSTGPGSLTGTGQRS